ncbi:DUF927 domain-containing protein [[Kitasatospora] papulosa]
MSDSLNVEAMLNAALTDEAKQAADDVKLSEFEKFRRDRNKAKKVQEALESASPEEHEEFEEWRKQRAAEAAQGPAVEGPRIPEPAYPYAEVFGMDPRTRTPQSYKVTHEGVFTRQPDSERWTRICLAPLVITSAYSDARGEQSVELAWSSRQSVVRKLVPRSMIRRGRKLVELLGDSGLPVMEADARLVERWLGEFEVANVTSLPNEYVARHLGWQPDGSFVTGPEDGVHLAPLYDDQQRAVNAYKPTGSAERWRDALSGLEPYPAARAVVAAAFAPVLLDEFREPSFMVDISFRSTSGKTTCLRCAMSVWADPTERAGAITSWNTTAMAMETKFNLVRGLPTALDDTMLARSPEMVGETPYTVSMDRGKSRGGQYVSGLEWQTIVLSTGERPVLSHTKGQGASVRALALQQRPLGEGSAALAERLTEVTARNFGHAGPAFASRFCALLKDGAQRDRLHRRRDELVDELRGTTAMTGRRATKIALLVLAEELASAWGILPYSPMPISSWHALFTEDVDVTDDRSEQAMEVIRGHIASNYASLYDSQSITSQSWQAGEIRVPHNGWLGVVRRPRTGGTQIAVQPDRVREILRRAEIEYDAVLGGWLEAGYLERTAKSGKDYLINVKVGKTGAKHLVFTEKAIPHSDAEDA